MKIQFRLLPIFATLLFLTFASCSDDDDSNPAYVCATCSDTPDALAVNDAIAKGVYKGVMIGSSGTIFVNIQNGSNDIFATLVIDGDTIALTSSVQIVNNEPYLAPFTGTYNGMPVSIVFSVEANGSIPTVVTSDIPGHPSATFTVVKETSTSLIEAFEGTYSEPSEVEFSIF